MKSGPATGARTGQSIRLRLGNGSWILVNGEYNIGRSADCHIVIDSPRVSRHHASLHVDGSTVTLRDHDSSNGVFVNGQAAGQAAVELRPDDQFVIGDAEFKIETATVSAIEAAADTLPPDRRSSAPPEVYRTTSGTFVSPPRAPSGIVPSGASSPEVTAKRHALELLGAVAERAIAAGHPQRAEQLLRPRLEDLMRKVRSRTALEPETRVQALRWSLRLCIAVKRTSWLEYGLELLTLTRHPCDAGNLAMMADATKAVPFDTAPFRSYAAVLRDLPGTLDKMATERFVSTLLANTLTR